MKIEYGAKSGTIYKVGMTADEDSIFVSLYKSGASEVYDIRLDISGVIHSTGTTVTPSQFSTYEIISSDGVVSLYRNGTLLTQVSESFSIGELVSEPFTIEGYNNSTSGGTSILIGEYRMYGGK